MAKGTRQTIKRGIIPRTYPKYPPDMQQKIWRFLAAFSLECTRMQKRMKQLLDASAGSQMIQSQLDYWRTAQSVTRDIAFRVGQRQRHLMEIEDEVINEVLESWGLTTKLCAGPEQYALSVSVSTDSGGTKLNGPPSENGRPASGQTRAKKR